MKRYISIAETELQDATTPIWAVNSAAETAVGSAGEIHIGIPKLSGSRIDNLSIPQTWLPIRLTDQIPRAQLLGATEFRTPVNSGLITLVTPEYAESILAQDGAEEERQRLTEYKRAVNDALRAQRLTDEVTELEEEASQFTQQFTMFAESLSVKSDTDALNAIRTRAKFTRAEIAHIIKHHLVDKPRTREFLTTKAGTVAVAGKPAGTHTNEHSSNPRTDDQEEA